jgi:hypothetical protein
MECASQHMGMSFGLQDLGLKELLAREAGILRMS